MPIADFIKQRGFRKWYERELVRSHSHLVLLLLAAVAVFAAIEVIGDRQGSDRWLLMAASLLVAGAIGVWAMRRYLFHLMRAEQIANQAACPQCKVYSRWEIEQHDVREDDPEAVSMLAVRCRKCEHRWRIEW